jgi:DNA-directed RNA polymerase specialized sigma subunit
MLAKLRAEVARMEAALDTLTEDEREIIEKMYIRPQRRVADKICEKFDIEVAAVYRRRNKALKKLEDFCVR